jgi:lipopolysaccharide transport system ATP-binding protein
MSNTVIKVENISKQYRLGNVGLGSLSHDLNRWWYSMRGKEDPYLKIGEENNRSVKGRSEYVWALRDINFEVKQGEALGIIGRNGAGKSTLLKILSRTTTPTTGQIKIKGRVASLLEVGTGFHGELTGRENIFLNGAILGMTKTEIRSKLDEIIDFSGVERYIDTPVKRYSSGMYVRLAFAVAAHLEPEILIIDEVLAVGDTEFQKKAIGKMKEVSVRDGRTVLFVSHNTTAIEKLCDNAIYVKNGRLYYYDKVESVIAKYIEETLVNSNNNNNNIISIINSLNSDENFQLQEVNVNQIGANNYEFKCSTEINVDFIYKIKETVEGLRIGFDLVEKKSGIIVFRTFHDDSYSKMEIINEGNYFTRFIIPSNFLKDQSYLISISIGIHNKRWIIFNTLVIDIKVNNTDGQNKLYADYRPGLIMPFIKNSTKKLTDDFKEIKKK